MIGYDLTAGGAAMCWDVFEAYDLGLVTNPNVFVMGEPGFAKSSLIKTYLARMVAIYGQSRWVTVTDPKGEYRVWAECMGLPVVKIEPGGRTCVNPLDAGAAGSLDDEARRRARQTSMVMALTATVLRRSLTPWERKLMRAVIDTMRDRVVEAGTSSTMTDLARLIASPTAEMCNQTRRTEKELTDDGEEVLFALDELLTGPLAGMFDGPSTVEVDWHGSGMVLDLSGVIGNTTAMALVMVAAMSWAAELKHVSQGRQKLNVNDESYYMYQLEETVEFCQERRKLGRSYGEANIDICHRPSDLSAQNNDGSAAAKMAEGLLSDSATKILFRQAPRELAIGRELLGLTDAEASAIESLVRGKAVWKLADHSLLCQHLLSERELSMVDTDHLMRRDGRLEPCP